MKYLQYLLIIFLISCQSEKKEDTIIREIKLKEIRNGHELVKLTINLEKTVADTSEIYYHADIRIKSRDSSINDSLFLIKGANGVLLPFSTKIP